MSGFTAPQAAVLAWMRDLSGRETVFFPQRAGKASFRFERVGPASDLALDSYLPTIVPPGKKMSPACEELLTFARGGGGALEAKASLSASPQILAGVRPCDLRAIFLLDLVQREGNPDPHWIARRAATTIVAVGCAKPCDDRCFCASVGSLDHREGADVFLTPAGKDVIVEALTPAGERIVAGAAGFKPAADADRRRDEAARARPAAFGRALPSPVSGLPAVLRDRWESAAWKKHVERCFSCGTCTMVCPTCYCFDVRDDLDFDLDHGVRTRTWDSCMLPQFTLVAGGHNFRADPAGRQRHRVNRKFEYLQERFGKGSFCVGCGRCGRQCTSGIDIFDIVRDVAAEGA